MLAWIMSVTEAWAQVGRTEIYSVLQRHTQQKLVMAWMPTVVRWVGGGWGGRGVSQG